VMIVLIVGVSTCHEDDYNCNDNFANSVHKW
jgi:hypothetical protein